CPRSLLVSVTSAGACAIAGRPMRTLAHRPTANRIVAFSMVSSHRESIPPTAIEPLAYYRSRAISEGPREGVVVDASALELQQYLFDLQGYLVIQNVLGTAEIAELNRLIDAQALP